MKIYKNKILLMYSSIINIISHFIQPTIDLKESINSQYKSILRSLH